MPRSLFSKQVLRMKTLKICYTITRIHFNHNESTALTERINYSWTETSVFHSLTLYRSLYAPRVHTHCIAIVWGNTAAVLSRVFKLILHGLCKHWGARWKSHVNLTSEAAFWLLYVKQKEVDCHRYTHENTLHWHFTWFPFWCVSFGRVEPYLIGV